MPRVMLLVIGTTAIVVAAGVLMLFFLPSPPTPRSVNEHDAPSPSPLVATAEPSPAANAQSSPASTPTGPSWFSDRTAASGVAFHHHSGDSPEKPFPSANGSGLAAFDYDLDGRMDLLFATGNDFPVLPDTSTERNRCYRNLGAWQFSETTEQTGLGYRGYAHGVTVADYDADGFPDVLITGYGPDAFFHNLGDGRFERVEVGLEDSRWSSSAAFFDANLDGLLDVYVCHYGNWSLDDNPFCGDAANNARVFCSPLTVEPVADAFFQNAGDGRFTDASDISGILVPPGRGLCVLAAHLDDDPALDLYIANDLNHNVFFTGSGTGTFTDKSDLSGVAYDSLGRVKSSMGIDAADTRGTGRFDLLVTDFQREYNLLFANAGNGMFVDASEASGVGPAGMQLVSWGVQFADLDLDGQEDAIVTSGHVGDERDADADLRQSGLVLHNQRGRFDPVAATQAGDYFLTPHQGRGLIAVDLDNDGDEDFVFNHRDEDATLLANDLANVASSNRLPLSLKLVGTSSNRDAIGAVVTLAGTPSQIRQIKGGGGYQSTRDPRLFFAVDRDTEAAVSIRWPNGTESRVKGLTAGGSYVVVESSGEHPPLVFLMREHRE